MSIILHRELELNSVILQDIEAFSDDNFDAIEWINKTYINGTDKHVNKEIFLSNLVSKMQLYVQQLVISLAHHFENALSIKFWTVEFGIGRHQSAGTVCNTENHEGCSGILLKWWTKKKQWNFWHKNRTCKALLFPWRLRWLKCSVTLIKFNETLVRACKI